MQFMAGRIGITKVLRMRIVYFKICNIPHKLPYWSSGEHVPINIDEFFYQEVLSR